MSSIFNYPDTVDQTPVPLAFSSAQLERVETLVKGLKDVDQRLEALPVALLDKDDLDEVERLRAIARMYVITAYEFVEPVAVFQDAIRKTAAFSEDLLVLMEKFVTLVGESLDEGYTSARAEGHTV